MAQAGLRGFYRRALTNLDFYYVGAGGKEELQCVLNAALSRLEAAIGVAQSQEARVASLVEQAILRCSPFFKVMSFSHET